MFICVCVPKVRIVGRLDEEAKFNEFTNE